MIPSRAKAVASPFARKPAAKTIKHEPMSHQRVSLKHDEGTPIVYDASDAGTGKTAVRIWSFARRRRMGGGKALVIAPKSLLKNAWANDFKKFAPDMKVVVATAANRVKAFAEDADAYITNHDAVKWLAQQKPAFFAGFDEVIIDEPTAFKHHTSQRSRAMAKIRVHFKYRRGMSATPNSNGICDVWHQIFILDDGLRLGKSFYGFRNSVCEPKQVVRMANMVEWVDKDGAEEAVFGLLSDIVIRHKIDDCADIPPVYHHEVEFEMSASHRKAYEQLEETQMLVLIPRMVAAKLTGNAPPPPAVTAINAASVTSKLLQVASGAVYDSEKKYHVVGEDRYDLILDLVEARKHPLVFFAWHHQRDLLAQKATARRLKYGVLDGEANDAQRSELVDRYQAGKLDVLFAHPKSAAHGLTLTKGTSIIWCGPIYDLELYEQGNKRQRRIGQKEKTEIIMVLAKDTIEEKVYKLLQSKDMKLKTLLSLFDELAPSVRSRMKK